jgi:hypothetical protein
MWIRLFLMCLLSVTTITLTQSEASASEKKMTDRQKVLHEMVSLEIDAIGGFIETFRVGFEEKNVKLSAESKSAYEKAKALFKEGKDIHAKNRPRPAYNKVREAFNALQPACEEVMGLEKAPKLFLDAVAKQVESTKSRIDRVADIVEEHASEAGKEAFKQSKATYKEAKAAWDAGKKKAGFKKVIQALKELDKAVNTTWPEAK